MPTSIGSLPDIEYSADDLVAVARRWGYRSTVDNSGDSEEAPLSSGQMTSLDFPSGVRACFSRLFTHRDHERDGVLERSLAIRLVTCDEDEYRLSRNKVCSLSRGGCVALDAGDDLYLSSRQRAGQSVEGLFVDACPDRLTDEELADRVSARLCGTRLEPLVVPAWFCAFTAAVCQAPILDPIMKLRIESCALELLACALEQNRADRPQRLASPDHKAIKRVRDYILAMPAADHNLDALARLAGMSTSTLKRKFPLAMGQSVFEFIRDARLDEARIAIEAGAKTVKQAAWIAGYAHPGNFSAAYRKRFGRSPCRVSG